MGSSLSKKTFLEYVNLDHSWETEDKSGEEIISITGNRGKVDRAVYEAGAIDLTEEK